MAKKRKSSKSTKKYPALFVLDGMIRVFEKGSILELYNKITIEEWERIVEETIKYKVFLECLKETAFKLLNETWTETDDWFRVQLDVAVSRMSNIDPLLVAKWNQEELSLDYTSRMKTGVAELQCLIEDMKAEESRLQSNISSI